VRLPAAIATTVAALLAVAVAAPRFSPATLFPIAVGWNLAALAVGIGVIRAAAKRFGAAKSAAGVAITVGAVAVATGVQWTGRLGTVFPCHRNWAWVPSYFLRSSPLRSVRATVDGTPIKVCYGSPRLRNRRVLGSPLQPYGQLWRTGANEPTTIRAGGPIRVGRIEVPDGVASIYSVPGPDTWEIVVNDRTGQWGIESEYPATAELGREVVAARTVGKRREAFAIWVEPAHGSEALGSQLVLAWDQTEVRIPLSPGASR